MPKLTNELPFDSELDKQSKELLKQNVLSNIDNQLPVDGIVLPEGGVGIIKSPNVIIPIKTSPEFSGTINSEGSVSFTINSNVPDCNIVIDGQPAYRTTPSKYTFSLTDIITSGTKTISLTKDGYISNEEYRINVIQNSNFRDDVLENYENTIENNDGIFKFQPKRKIFTQTPTYVFKIEKLLNGEVIQSDVTNSTFEIKELSFGLIQDKIKRVIEPDVKTYNVTVQLKGPNNSVTITNLKSQESTKITEGTTTLIVEVGTTLQILSTNLALYKISKLNVTSEGSKGRQLSAIGNDSVTSEYVVDNNTVIDVETQDIVVVQEPNQAIIKLLSPDENRKYNKNTNEPYPVLLETQNITQVTLYVKDKTYSFNIQPPTETLPNIEGIGVTGKKIAVQQAPTIVTIPPVAFDSIGNYKIYIVGKTAGGLEQQPIEFKLSVVDETYVGIPDIQTINYPKEIVGADYAGTDVDFEIGWTSRDTDFVKIYVNDSKGFYQEGPNARITLNIKKLLDFALYKGPLDSINFTLKLVPYNISGNKELVGKEEIIAINFKGGDLTIPKNVAINRIASAFTSQFDETVFGEESSKYLNHLLHLGNGDNKVVTTWTGSEDSLILKLYEPLPVSIQPNQLVWISKPQSNPIIETVSLTTETEIACNALKGPNFSLQPDNGIEFQVYEELVGSGSISSTEIINRYASSVGIDTKKLHIEYTSGSEYVFENFINFSSAKERVDNFLYKIQLIEFYNNIFVTNTSSSLASPFEKNEANSALQKKNQLIQGFDGFENYLYFTTNLESNNLAYPKTNPSSSIILSATSSLTTLWYDEIYHQAEVFDKNNVNRLSANIPAFLIEDTTNEDFVTFLDMIGQHFDIIWTYINSLAKIKSVEASKYKGIPNDIVQHVLESHGWDVKKAFNSNFLWEYAFGTYKDGTQKYSQPLKTANEEVWRRILNNLPYILKHKGTARAMKAIMACYGVPQSMLTIMEFGGPKDPTKGGSSKFTFDDRTAAIYLSSSACVKVPWKQYIGTSDYPNTIEFRFKPDSLPNTISTLVSGSEWTLDLVKTTGSFGRLELNFGGDIATSEYIDTSYFDITYVFGPDYKTGSLDFPISTQYYSNVAINRYNTPGTGSWFTVWLGTSDGQRIITSVSMSMFSIDSQWQSGSHLQIGSNTFTGNVDEVRLWKVPLERSKFNNHVLFPDAINGNSYSASTEDLLFRLDFEYPKDRIADPLIKNVAINTAYDGNPSYATASNMYVASTYPYQYTPYDRTVTADVPSIGFGYSNKIRFESASLVTDLSYKTRATKKAFDQAPIDSNRLGLFFSPIRELNMDIVKSFGDFNIDNYIGDPRDEYKDTYTELETLREYYFERMDQNINEYIQLVRYIDKSLFEVLAELAPARAKISKGLLIEPHFLERSKTAWKPTIAENNSYDTSILTNEDLTLESEFIPKEAEIDAETNTILVAERNDYTASIENFDLTTLIAETPFYSSSITYTIDDGITVDIPTYTASIEAPDGAYLSAEVDSMKFLAVGMDKDSLANAGYGLYARNGATIRAQYEGVFGNYTETHISASVANSDRKNAYLVKESYVTNVQTQTQGWPTTTTPGLQVKYTSVPTTNYKYKISEVPHGTTISTGGNIVEVTPVNGYLPTHYRYVSGLTEGLKRSFFKGSTQRSGSTPDGLDPVEIFTTNPNILKVANTGRGSGEPILIVD